MAREIERKYLVIGQPWDDGTPGSLLAQGYLSTDPARTVRVRIAGERAWLTVKGLSEGISRDEFEYPIPSDDARAMLALCLAGTVEKSRHEVTFAGKLWEIDVFHGANDGLVVAEIELDHPDEQPPLPPWLGPEVTDDPRYYNSNLAIHPFREWPTTV